MNKGDLRVWWIPQVPMKPFHVSVKSTDEAKLILKTLAHYDQFQLDNNIKPDYSNAGGLEVYVGLDVDYETTDGWEEWSDEQGNGIDDISEPQDGDTEIEVQHE